MAFVNTPILPESAKVGLGVFTILGICAIPVFGTGGNKREGHDPFSSEKPEAIRGEQRRNLEAEKARLESPEVQARMAAARAAWAERK